MSDDLKDALYAEAFEFGWQSFLQHGRDAVIAPVAFESFEPSLREAWLAKESLKREPMPWELAREAAQNAWDRVQDALVDGSQPKSSAR